MNTPVENETIFTTKLSVLVLTRPQGVTAGDWQELDLGEGMHRLPPGQDVYVRVHNYDDRDLKTLVDELAGVSALTHLNLSENRNITDKGMEFLGKLPRLRGLNLSSCSISNQGLDALRALNRLETLDISYCNRITDLGLKALKSLSRLTFLDVQGCVKLTTGGLSKLRRSTLTIHVH